MNDLDSLNFDDSYKNKKIYDYDGLTINLISFDDLVKNKKATGRTKDLLDLENLIS
jgi:hypothetical protein